MPPKKLTSTVAPRLKEANTLADQAVTEMEGILVKYRELIRDCGYVLNLNTDKQGVFLFRLSRVRQP